MSIIQRLVREPALILGVVVAALNLAVLFGVHITADQLAAIGVLVGALVALIRFVTTPAGEVAAQLKPGDAIPIAGPAATVPDGEPVHVEPAAAA